MIQCPNGHELSEPSPFCPICGQPIQQPEGQVPPPNPEHSTTGVAAEPEPDAPAVKPTGPADGSGFSGRMYLLGLGIPILIGLIGFGAWKAYESSRPAKHDITGLMTLNDDSTRWYTGDPCSGAGGYSDIDEGAQVTVTNEKGDTIATGYLGQGETISSKVCAFKFTVENAPDAKFYAVEVSRRGELRFSKAEMEANDWFVAASLGGN